jgi:hypothetical protein
MPESLLYISHISYHKALEDRAGAEESGSTDLITLTMMVAINQK